MALTLKQIQGMTTQQIFNYLENCDGQRDDALVRIAAYDANTANVMAVLAGYPLTVLNPAHDTDPTQPATIPNPVTVAADKQAALDKLTTDNTTANAAALTAATAPLHQQIVALQTQISGTKGSYKVTATAVQEIALALAAVASQTTPAGLLNASVTGWLEGLAKGHTEAILGATLAKYQTLAPADQAAILGALGLSGFAALGLADQMKALQAMAVSAFQALDPAVQNVILGKLSL